MLYPKIHYIIKKYSIFFVIIVNMHKFYLKYGHAFKIMI